MDNAKFWEENKPYYYCEFIDEPDFPEEKRKRLQVYKDWHFIPNDFTIYINKNNISDKETENKIDRNFALFFRILDNTPVHKIDSILEFHLDKYSGEKEDFLKFTQYKFGSIKSMKGNVVMPRPQKYTVVIEWCKNKQAELNSTKKQPRYITNSEIYVNEDRIKELEELDQSIFDLSKLIQICKELNLAHQNNMNLTKAVLVRTIINHIPPIFTKDPQVGYYEKFTQVVNNYNSTGNKKSFKEVASKLQDILRNIADSIAHSLIRKKDSLPNENQVNFSNELDFILMEICKILKK